VDATQVAAPPAAGPGLGAAAWPSPDVKAAPTTRAGLSFGAKLRRDWVMLALAAPGML